jgi:hypothetical protein
MGQKETAPQQPDDDDESVQQPLQLLLGLCNPPPFLGHDGRILPGSISDVQLNGTRAARSDSGGRPASVSPRHSIPTGEEVLPLPSLRRAGSRMQLPRGYVSPSDSGHHAVSWSQEFSRLRTIVPRYPATPDRG